MAGFIRCLSLEEFHFLHQVGCHCVGHDELDKVNELIAVPEHGEDKVVVTAEQNNLARWRQPFISLADGAEAESVI